MKTPIFQNKILDQLAKLEVLLLDMDGVMTDGKITISHIDGQMVRTRGFDSLDGNGIDLLKKNTDIKVFFLSATDQKIILEDRARKLRVDGVLENREDKLATFLDFLDTSGVDPSRIAYVGDDMNDAPMMGKVEVFFTPNDAHYYLLANADVVLQNVAGKGAVREVCDLILYAKGKFEEIYPALTIDVRP